MRLRLSVGRKEKSVWEGMVGDGRDAGGAKTAAANVERMELSSANVNEQILDLTNDL